MKKILLLSCVCLLLLGCSEDSSPPEVVKDDIKPPFTLKYELLFSKPINEQCEVEYFTYQKTNNLEWIPKGSTTWSKTVRYLNDINPHSASFNTYAKFQGGGTVTFNVYVNDVLYFHQKEDRAESGNPTPGYGFGISIY